MIDWPDYQAGLAPLRARLLAEFTERSALDRPELLAVFATDRGRYELWQAPEAATPELYLDDATGRRQIVDFAAEAGDDPEFLLGDLAISPDGRQLAYTVDPTGGDVHRLRLIDLTEPAVSRAIRDDLGAAVGWHDGHLVCAELDDAMSPAVVVRLSPAGLERQELCRAEPGEYFELYQAADGRTMVISAESHTGNQLLLLGPGALRPEPIRPPGQVERARFDTGAGLDWLLTSAVGQADQLLVRTTGASWRPVAGAAPGTHWDEVAALAHGALLVERYAGGQRLRRADPSGSPPVEVHFEQAGVALGDDPATITVVPGVRPAGGEPVALRETWRAAPQLYRIPDSDDGAQPIGPVSSAIRLTVNRLSATSADGTRIPITVLGPPDRPPPWPLVLYAYGAYGVPVDPYYTPFRASLLERGAGFAVAHVRGGGELGPAWHEAGRQQHKHRAVEDYLACVRYLISTGWCPPDGLVARCRSAGGMVIGAAINQAPELFRAAVLEVPFVDCLRTLSDPAAALTELEWAEWGDPVHEPGDRSRIAAWSPVDNVVAGPYPAMLITAGLADVRVPPDGPRRYAEAVRAASTSAAPVFLLEQTSGHVGYSDVEQDRQGEAELLAFVFDQLGRAE